ncbi:MAG: STAS domain-containing protein [Phycisphaerales bacterium JB041]
MHDAALPVRIDSQGGATVLAPQGDIDMSRAPAFREHVRRAIQSGASRVVIDLSEVEYMDSSGLATLVEAMRNAKQAKAELLLCGLHQKVLAIFEIARLHQFFKIVATVEDAVSSA